VVAHDVPGKHGELVPPRDLPQELLKPKRYRHFVEDPLAPREAVVGVVAGPLEERPIRPRHGCGPLPECYINGGMA
jgi:hypothetical protein